MASSVCSAVTIGPVTTRPEPLPIEIVSPTARRLTVTAWRASGPVIATRSPTSALSSSSEM